MKKNFFGTPEGIIFLLGVAVFVSGVFFVYPLNIPRKWEGLLAMILAGVAGGKGVSIPVGLSFLPSWLVTVVASLHDLVAVFLFFPLIVLFRNKAIKGSFMGEIVRTSEETAQKHHRLLKSLGVLGVGFFVWVPLTMTGPVVGSVLGVILGMDTVTIIFTVVIAAILSALCWTYLFEFMLHWAKGTRQAFPAVAVAIILALILAIRIIRKRRVPSALRDSYR